VLGIVDGDTVNVQLNGQIVPVRYIGIDAPDTGKEYYGQAAQLNQDFVYSKTVTLITDVSDKDSNGILLRYVIVDDNFVNLELVKQGFALALSAPPDTSCSTIFTNAQSQAQTAAIGVWVPTLAPFVPSDNGSSGFYRIGALCVDGTSSGATGRGACSWHGGVSCWKYNDGQCLPY
jgi:endonuclease YncB( thermonuclease family)